MRLLGWVECQGQVLGTPELETLLARDPKELCRCGGEFFLSHGSCRARDRLGIIPGDSTAGMLECSGQVSTAIDPGYPPGDLDTAIGTAVALRATEGIVALSGGVDSSLIAARAGLECVVVGTEESHDIPQATRVARALRVPCAAVTLSPAEIRDALTHVAQTIPHLTPLSASIATTLYFVAEHAHERGFRRILCGQGADELFGGYARYLRSTDLGRDLEMDFSALLDEIRRDQVVAALHDTYFSLPYLDLRVVAAARQIPPSEKVVEGTRKRPLRIVAGRYLPREIAWYEKKAMQYGSGIAKAIRTLARENGYKTSLQRYIEHLGSG